MKEKNSRGKNVIVQNSYRTIFSRGLLTSGPLSFSFPYPGHPIPLLLVFRHFRLIFFRLFSAWFANLNACFIARGCWIIILDVFPFNFNVTASNVCALCVWWFTFYNCLTAISMVAAAALATSAMFLFLIGIFYRHFAYILYSYRLH